MTVVGIDVGGSKIAAATVDVRTGAVLQELRVPTPVRSGGKAVLAECVRLAHELAPDRASAVGIGLCEFVDLAGRPTSSYTVDWVGLDVEQEFGMMVRVESDVRAGALAEARFGAGRGCASFVYVTVGSGVSHCLVLEGQPLRGARGNAIVTGAPPVEFSVGGLALAQRAGVETAEQVLADPARAELVDEAATELGRALASLVNALDPEALVIGGGLGLVAEYRERVVAAARAAIEHPVTRELRIVPAALGARSGVIGAALAAVA